MDKIKFVSQRIKVIVSELNSCVGYEKFRVDSEPKTAQNLLDIISLLKSNFGVEAEVIQELDWLELILISIKSQEEQLEI